MAVNDTVHYSQAYLDVVGTIDRSWPAAYSACIQHECPRCAGAPYQTCINPTTGRPAKAPCLARMNLS
jgi:hypothetical protein